MLKLLLVQAMLSDSHTVQSALLAGLPERAQRAAVVVEQRRDVARWHFQTWHHVRLESVMRFKADIG